MTASAAQARNDLYDVSARPPDPQAGDLVFQLLSWHACDEVAENDDDDDDDDDDDSAGPGAFKKRRKAYFIKVFGALQDGRAVALTVTGFTPYFYVKLGAGDLSAAQASLVARHLRTKVAPGCDVVDIRHLERKDFWGFTNGAMQSFLRVCCSTHRGMRNMAERVAKDPVVAASSMAKPVRLSLYESNIDPLLRFFHVRDLAPAGWMRVPRGRYSMGGPAALEARCQLDFQCRWQDCHAERRDEIAPLLIASVDIECSSSHGDFPVAKKDYRRVAQDLLLLFQSREFEGKGEFAAKELLIDAMLAPFAEHLPEDVRRARPGSRDLLDRGLMAAAYPKTPFDAGRLLTAAKRCVDDVYVALRGRTPASGRAQSSGSESASVLAVVAGVLNQAFGALARLQGDCVIQIGTTFHKYGSRELCHQWIGTLGSCEAIEGVAVEACDTEKDLLLCWARMVRDMDPDVVVGWNIFGFDMEYIHDRAEETGCVEQVCRSISRLLNIERPRAPRGAPARWLREQRLSSSALGDNFMRYIDMHGRAQIDLMKVIQRDHKLDSYKLDLVAQHFLGQKKNDVSPHDIFRLFRGSAADRRRIAEYCVQDCALCNHLAVKLEIVANNVGMANVCSVPLSFIFMRGQGVKIFSLVAKQCKVDGFLVPTLRYVERGEGDEEGEEGYEGAIVLDPQPGMYLDDPVSVLDYASLYPSSMISENLSHDCFVMDPKYDNLSGVEYLTVSYEEGSRTVQCRFAQIEGKGVLPRILMQLLKQRKLTRKRMESVVIEHQGAELQGFYDADAGVLTDLQAVKHSVGPGLEARDAYSDFQKAVLDGLQLAYKVTANSLYGQMGARTSPLYLKPIAACTTATGRKMILMAKKFLEENYCARVVYGDSVAGHTPVLVRRGATGPVRIVAVDQVAACMAGGRWSGAGHAGGKEACEMPEDVQVYSDQGWTRLRRVIRHALPPGKRMVRVATRCGFVDVTDDHSLLRDTGEPVTPNDLSLGQRLLHRRLPPPSAERADTDADADPEAARELCLAHCGATEEGLPFAIRHGSSPRLRREYLLALPHARAVDARSGRTLITLTAASQVLAAEWAWLASSIGMDVRVYSNDNDSINIICSDRLAAGDAEANGNGDDERVVSIQPLLQRQQADAGYVYDLTTDNHHFAAGVGSLVVHNTDSIFIVFPKGEPLGSSGVVIHEKGHAAIMPSIRLAMQASAEFKKLLKPPHDLEYEKTFWPWIIFSKKRYVGNLYEFDDHKYKQKSMGIVLKRRDNAPIVKRIYGGCIDIILKEQNVQASLAFLKGSLNELVDGATPLEDLVVTKTLRAEYKNPDQIAHQVLAQRMGERDPGNKPQVNDRVPFVYIEAPPPARGQKLLQGDRIEHPDYIREKQLRVDYRHYITNQIMKPVLQLYALVVEQLPGCRKGDGFWSAERVRWVREYEGDADKADDKIQALREAEAKAILFDPVLRTVDNRANHMSEITRWFKPVSQQQQQPL